MEYGEEKNTTMGEQNYNINQRGGTRRSKLKNRPKNLENGSEGRVAVAERDRREWQ